MTKVKAKKFGKGEAWAVSASLNYALSSVVLKWALVDAPPLYGVFIKLVPVWVLSTFMIISNGKHHQLSPNSKDFLGKEVFVVAVIGGILGFVFGNLALFGALNRGGVVIAQPVVGTQIIWASVISYLFLKEAINFSMLVGMAISISGIALLAFGNAGMNLLNDGWTLAFPMALLAALCFSSNSSFQRYLFTRKKLDRWTVIFLMITSAELVMLVVFIIQKDMYMSAVTVEITLKFLFAGIFGALAIVSVATANSLTQVASVATINSTNTALAPLISMLILGEKLNLVMFVGIIMIMFGVILVQIRKPVPTIRA